ncbi:hypothetical protein H696_03024 [Fonticula alba]|uniref:Acireductone dioxygenase n=1 Tax=Fonticula alba TaxID=691883 RepID=A0A058Z8N8_FONAL|nr:hypothetical protein H696_03024 [Fonticula alba]KCV70669.1 hypothetical protein H696_03024 [Fonticula alba]|eukprot:XP_009495185.1 hypothetical protein H696_03024 [Fonticula alba]
MVSAWLMSDIAPGGDPRLAHVSAPLPEAQAFLKDIGVLYWRLAPIRPEGDLSDVPESEYLAQLDAVASERGYKNRDQVEISPTKMPNYETLCGVFFQEHLHDDEEIRFCAGGSGYFDVRDRADRWIRIAVTPGDLLVLPAGIYHRFSPDEKNYIKAIRLFQDAPRWEAHARTVNNVSSAAAASVQPAGDLRPARADYLTALNTSPGHA